MKKRFNKHTVTGFIIVAVIMATGVMTLIVGANGLARAVRSGGSAQGVIDGINAVYNDGLFLHDAYIEIYSAAQAALGATLIDDAQYGYIIKDTHGKLHFPMPPGDPQGSAADMLKLKSELDALGTPLLYIQAPNKKLKHYTVHPTGAENVANEDADSFLALVNAGGLRTLDLREKLIADNLNRDSLFFATDHHWTTAAAFWAYQSAVDELSAAFGLALDPDGFYTELANFRHTLYPQSFLGSLGKRVGRGVAGVDDYTLITPGFATDYAVYDMNKSESEPMTSGTFDEAIVVREAVDNPDIGANRHGAYFYYDFGHLKIVNRAAQNDIKLLLIKDSFALPFSAYLSTCVAQLHVMDMRDPQNTYTPEELCVLEGFDAVIVLYNPEVFFKPMFDFF